MTSETLLFSTKREVSCKKGEKMKNKFAIILLAILAVSAFSLTAGAYATPFMNWQPVMPNATVSSVSLQTSYVRMDGKINMFGSTPALGAIQAQTRTVINGTTTIQGYACSAIWTTNVTRPISAVRAKENFTYTYYTARLVNGSFAGLDYNGNSFFMNGTWNVWNITATITIITDANGKITAVNTDQNAVKLATQAYGELVVPSSWSTFTLTINGVDPVSGIVYAHLTTSRSFNPFMIDGSGASTSVTTADLKGIVNAYGSMPGWGNYDIRMDPCMHYKIDICDLSTAAANLNSAQ